MDAADAESVCYHGRLAAMPGKFDASKADALGVPRGAVRGALVRGEDVVLPDGRTIRSEDVVARRRAGFRFAVVDVRPRAPGGAADPTSDAGEAFRRGVRRHGEGEGRLAVVVHLAPAAVATSAAYARWMETCGAFRAVGDGTNPFDRPRHLMVHSEATGGRACSAPPPPSTRGCTRWTPTSFRSRATPSAPSPTRRRARWPTPRRGRRGRATNPGGVTGGV